MSDETPLQVTMTKCSGHKEAHALFRFFYLPHMVIFLKKCIIFYCPLLEFHINAASIDGNHFLNSALG